MKISEIILLGVVLFLGGWIALSNNPANLGGFGGQDAYVVDVDYATTSISTCIRSTYHPAPTSTDPSVPTIGTHNQWVCSTTTYDGTPDEIPNDMGNTGFKYCLDADSSTGQAVRFWFENTTSTNNKMSVGVNSSGFLLTAGNCWDTNEYDIVWGGKVYALASTTTSTLRYHIFKSQ